MKRQENFMKVIYGKWNSNYDEIELPTLIELNNLVTKVKNKEEFTSSL